MNIFNYAAIAEANWKKNLSDMNPYEPKYSFYHDFSIADFMEAAGAEKDAVRKTFKDVLKSWGSNIEAITEIVMVLNHKIWSFYGKVDSLYMGCSDEKADYFSKLYDELWRKAEEFVMEKYKDDEKALSYFYATLD